MKNNIIKYIFVNILLLSIPQGLWSADGDEFSIVSEEGIEIHFQVISEENKTCKTRDFSVNNEPCVSKDAWVITIPAFANGYKVIEIGNKSFYECYLHRAVIPNTVENIGYAAFGWCRSLYRVNLPSSIEKIGEYAFEFTDLSYVTLSEGIKSIGEYAFSGCSNLTFIRVKGKEKILAAQSSFNSSNNALLVVPSGMKSTYASAPGWQNFSHITEEKQLSWNYNEDYITLKTDYADAGFVYTEDGSDPYTMPYSDNFVRGDELKFHASNNVKAISFLIGKEYCAVFDSVPESIRSLYNGSKFVSNTKEGVSMIFQIINENDKTCRVYENCIDTTTQGAITIPSRVNGYEVISIYKEAFSSCKKITTVSIPETVRSIGEYAFYDCESLKSTNIPNQVKVINEASFWGTGLESVVMPNSIVSIEGYAFENCKKLSVVNLSSALESIGYAAFSGCERIPVIDIPNQVNYIGDYAFLNCSQLESAILPEALEDIGYATFANCQKLNNLNVPDRVKSIGRNAFNGCEGLRSITLSKSLTSIEYGAFAYCSNLSSINLPNGFENIGQASFYNCTKLKTIDFPQTLETIGSSAFEDCKSLETISLPGEITSIEDYTFLGCSSLSQVILPGTIKEIGYASFYDCGELSSINLPSNINSIGAYSFGFCSKLKSLEIPEGVTKVDTCTFFRCTNLSSVKLPNSLTRLNNGAFSFCSNLKSLNMTDNIEEIEDSVFYGCKTLPVKHLPMKLKNIGKLAFYDCDSIRSIILPSEVKTIGDFAFTACDSVNYVSLPAQLVSIGVNALFVHGEALLVRSKMKQPLTLSNWMLVNRSECLLVVPKGSRDSYRNAEYRWTNFKYVAEEDSLGWEIQNSKLLIKPSNPNATIYYTIDGTEPTLESANTTGMLSLDASLPVKAFAMYYKDEYFAYLYRDAGSFDGETAKVNIAGSLQSLLADYDKSEIKKLNVVGYVNENDLQTIKTLTSLDVLDMKDAMIINSTLLDRSFENSNMIVCHLPSGIKTVGKEIFVGCKRLAAVIWDAGVIPAGVMMGIENPNLLLYVQQEGNAENASADGVQNIISQGRSRKIVLSDAEGNNNFFCPIEFEVDDITYTHDYRLSTPPNTCAGWETLALPFEVQTISHETKGIILPFAAKDSSKPQFWLYSYENSGFTPSPSIKAYKPYLISMPKDDSFSDEYNLSGKVTFSAKNAVIAPTNIEIPSEKGLSFVPCFLQQEKSNSILTINKESDGSMFVRGKREPCPFEAYAITDVANAPQYFPIINVLKTPTSLNDLVVGAKDYYIKVYTLSGLHIMSGKRDEVTKQLPKGIYIINGKKTIVE